MSQSKDEVGYPGPPFSLYRPCCLLLAFLVDRWLVVCCFSSFISCFVRECVCVCR